MSDPSEVLENEQELQALFDYIGLKNAYIKCSDDVIDHLMSKLNAEESSKDAKLVFLLERRKIMLDMLLSRGKTPAVTQ